MANSSKFKDLQTCVLGWWKCKLVQPVWTAICQSISKLKLYILLESVLALLKDIHQHVKLGARKKFISALFVISNIRNILNVSQRKQLNDPAALKKTNWPQYVLIWKNLQDIFLSEKRYRHTICVFKNTENIYVWVCVFIHIWVYVCIGVYIHTEIKYPWSTYKKLIRETDFRNADKWVRGSLEGVSLFLHTLLYLLNFGRHACMAYSKSQVLWKGRQPLVKVNPGVWKPGIKTKEKHLAASQVHTQKKDNRRRCR